MAELAVSLNGFGRSTQAFALDCLRKAGVHRVELWGNVAHFHPAYMNETQAAAMAAEIRRQGFELVSFLPEGGSYPVNPAATDEALRADTLEYYRHCIRLCAAMGIPQMAVHPGYGLRDCPPETALAAAGETLAEIAGFARAQGVKIAILHTGSVHVGAWEVVCRLAEAANAGVALDVSLTAVEGESLAKRLQSGLVRMVRLSDGPGGHLGFGDGSLPMKEVLKQIEGAGLADRCILALDNRRYVLRPELALAQTAAQMEAMGSGAEEI